MTDINTDYYKGHRHIYPVPGRLALRADKDGVLVSPERRIGLEPVNHLVDTMLSEAICKGKAALGRLLNLLKKALM